MARRPHTSRPQSSRPGPSLGMGHSSWLAHPLSRPRELVQGPRRSRNGGPRSMPNRRLPPILPVLLVVLAGCAASQPVLRPADLPEHFVESPIVLHWRIDREPDRATAVGLVEIPQNPDRVELVMLELQG